LQKEYEKLRVERTKECLKSLQVPVASMVRPPPPPKILMNAGDHVNVGEWVEVEHCYSVGICSDGGVAVVIAFDEKGADVRCVPNFVTTFLHFINYPAKCKLN
jgi:hypothetical protein